MNRSNRSKQFSVCRQSQFSSRRRRAVAVAAGLSALGVGVLSQPALAGQGNNKFYWVGPANGDYNTIANWDGPGDGTPAARVPDGSNANFDDATFNSSTVNQTETVHTDATTNLLVAGLTFQNTGTTNLVAGTSTTNDSTTRVINNRGDIIFNSNSGPVNIGVSSGTINRLAIQPTSNYSFIDNTSSSVVFWFLMSSPGAGTSGSPLPRTETLDGSGTSGTFAGGIGSGTGTFLYVIKQGTGSWTLGNGSITGAFTMNGGTIWINGSNAFGDSTAGANKGLIINAGTLGAVGTIARLIPASVPLTIGGDFTLGGGGTVETNFAGTVNLGAATRQVTVNNNTDASTGISSWTGAVSNGGLTKTGLGNLILSSASNTYAGPTTVSAGKLILLSNEVNTSAVTSNALLQLGHSATNNVVLKTGSVSVTGQIDLTNNKLAVGTGTTASAVADYVKAGRNSAPITGAPQWNGTGGIITSESDAVSGLRTLGVVPNADLGKATFGGVPVASTDTLVMYTYNGDANLDGHVNADDYFQIDSHYNQGVPANDGESFNSGDFNYDGQINGDDYALIDAAFAGQTVQINNAPGLGGVSAVPEPASLGLLALSGCGLIRRRRRGS